MSTVDLSARRQARQEAAGEPHLITYDDIEMRLPTEMPFTVLEAVMDARGTSELVRALASAVEPPEAWHRFRKVASREDVDEFVEASCEVWGLPSLGGSSASDGSSNDDGSSSRPTSSGTTDSTSDTSAGDPTPSESADSQD